MSNPNELELINSSVVIWNTGWCAMWLPCLGHTALSCSLCEDVSFASVFPRKCIALAHDWGTESRCSGHRAGQSPFPAEYIRPHLIHLGNTHLPVISFCDGASLLTHVRLLASYASSAFLSRISAQHPVSLTRLVFSEDDLAFATIHFSLGWNHSLIFAKDILFCLHSQDSGNPDD